MSAFFFLSDIYKETIIMSDKNNKNRLRKKSAPSYSEIPSGDVHPSILGGATDTVQTSKDADANIANVTKGAKNNIRKFLNNDFPINYSGGFRTVVVGLRQLLKLRYKGGSNYAKYQTPNGIFSFRLSDHNANGNNFENSEINISVYVAYHEYDVPESEVKYTEYKITPQLFENNPQSVVSAIVNGISKALNGESFSLDDSIATGDSFPKETPIENNKTDKNESKNMNRKNTIRLTESELKKVITESVKKVLQEGHPRIEELNQFNPELAELAKLWGEYERGLWGKEWTRMMQKAFNLRKDKEIVYDFESYTGISWTEFNTHWNRLYDALHKLYIAFQEPAEESNDGGYYDWH